MSNKDNQPFVLKMLMGLSSALGMGRALAGDAGLAEPLLAWWCTPAGVGTQKHGGWGVGLRACVPPPRQPHADGHVLGWVPYAPRGRGPPLASRALSSRRGHVGLVRTAHGGSLWCTQ